MSEFENQKITYGKSQLLKDGKETLFMGFGAGVFKAWQTYELVKDTLDPAILDLVFVKPLDETMLLGLAKKYKKWYIFSDSVKLGGVASAILEFLSDRKIKDIEVVTFEYEDGFIKHGNSAKIEDTLGLSIKGLAKKILSLNDLKNQ